MGISRTVARLQQDESNRRTPLFGQLVTERVIVPRNERKFLPAARKAFKLYSRRRSILDFAFDGEEGTGVGPTAEFYTLVAMEFQKLCSGPTAMWISDSSTNTSGLFPCLLPTDKKNVEKVLDSFKFLGQIFARAILDKRCVDLHLSLPFCELLCGNRLTVEDLELADPALHTLARLAPSEVEGLCQSMVWAGRELVPGGNEVDVTAENFDEFKCKAAALILEYGIEEQMEALREGFNEVFPIKNLHMITSTELRTMITGEPMGKWTVEELREALEPKHGYTKNSAQIDMLLEVLVGLDMEDKRAFLWWATGCPRPPSGGLKRLQPNRLSIVRKPEEGQLADDMMLSVNVCNKAIKLPEYSSTSIMRERLLTAMHSKDAREFHFS